METKANFKGALLAVSVVTNTWEKSIRFYTQVLGFKILKEDVLSSGQRETFGTHLKRYALLGQDRASVIRLLETDDKNAVPNRIGARPWDIGLGVIESGTAAIDKVYSTLIANRFGAIAPPMEFAVDGPEPLGYVVMKSLGVFGPSGEQFFITQITERKGGTPLWEQRKDIVVFPPGNVVISLKDRTVQDFYKDTFNLHAVNDLPLQQKEAATIMGGPMDMGFNMCLMGNGQYKSGMEQHVYGELHPDYGFNKFPSDFSKTGFASACWAGDGFEGLADKIMANGGEVIADGLLPLRDDPTPNGIVYRGPAGEIVELVRD